MSWCVEWPSSTAALAALGETWEMTEAGVGHRVALGVTTRCIGAVGEHQPKAGGAFTDVPECR